MRFIAAYSRAFGAAGSPSAASAAIGVDIIASLTDTSEPAPGNSTPNVTLILTNNDRPPLLPNPPTGSMMGGHYFGPNGTLQFVFSEPLLPEGMSAVEAALAPTAGEIVSYVWVGNQTLTITATDTAGTFIPTPATVTNIADAMGNSSPLITLIMEGGGG